MILMLALTYVAEIWKELTLTALIGQIWTLPFLVWLYIVDTTTAGKWLVFAMVSLLLAYPNGTLGTRKSTPCNWLILSTCTTAHPIQVAWNSRNSNAVRSRTVSAACYNMFCQAGGIIASNIYRTGERVPPASAIVWRYVNVANLSMQTMHPAIVAATCSSSLFFA